jgi:hypothetical protein
VTIVAGHVVLVGLAVGAVVAYKAGYPVVAGGLGGVALLYVGAIIGVRSGLFYCSSGSVLAAEEAT